MIEIDELAARTYEMRLSAKITASDLEKIEKIRSLPPKPVSYADEYTRAIRMLELSVEDIIEIQDSVFDQLVLDEWHWKTSFVASTALYKSMI